MAADVLSRSANIAPVCVCLPPNFLESGLSWPTAACRGGDLRPRRVGAKFRLLLQSESRVCVCIQYLRLNACLVAYVRFDAIRHAERPTANGHTCRVSFDAPAESLPDRSFFGCRLLEVEHVNAR